MRYVALLRAVNVGGRTVKMDRLRTLFEELKLRNVETYIASGNVIFESTAAASAPESPIEKHLATSLGFDGPTLVRSTNDLAAVPDHDPFAERPPMGELGALYVGFLKSAAARDGMKKIDALADASNTFRLHGRELYWRADDRRAVLTIPIATFERAFGCET